MADALTIAGWLRDEAADTSDDLFHGTDVQRVHLSGQELTWSDDDLELTVPLPVDSAPSSLPEAAVDGHLLAHIARHCATLHSEARLALYVADRHLTVAWDLALWRLPLLEATSTTTWVIDGTLLGRVDQATDLRRLLAPAVLVEDAEFTLLGAVHWHTVDGDLAAEGTNRRAAVRSLADGPFPDASLDVLVPLPVVRFLDRLLDTGNLTSLAIASARATHGRGDSPALAIIATTPNGTDILIKTEIPHGQYPDFTPILTTSPDDTWQVTVPRRRLRDAAAAARAITPTQGPGPYLSLGMDAIEGAPALTGPGVLAYLSSDDTHLTQPWPDHDTAPHLALPSLEAAVDVLAGDVVTITGGSTSRRVLLTDEDGTRIAIAPYLTQPPVRR